MSSYKVGLFAEAFSSKKTKDKPISLNNEGKMESIGKKKKKAKNSASMGSTKDGVNVEFTKPQRYFQKNLGKVSHHKKGMHSQDQLIFRGVKASDSLSKSKANIPKHFFFDDNTLDTKLHRAVEVAQNYVPANFDKKNKRKKSHNQTQEPMNDDDNVRVMLVKKNKKKKSKPVPMNSEPPQMNTETSLELNVFNEIYEKATGFVIKKHKHDITVENCEPLNSNTSPNEKELTTKKKKKRKNRHGTTVTNCEPLSSSTSLNENELTSKKSRKRKNRHGTTVTNCEPLSSSTSLNENELTSKKSRKRKNRHGTTVTNCEPLSSSISPNENELTAKKSKERKNRHDTTVANCEPLSSSTSPNENELTPKKSTKRKNRHDTTVENCKPLSSNTSSNEKELIAKKLKKRKNRHNVTVKSCEPLSFNTSSNKNELSVKKSRKRKRNDSDRSETDLHVDSPMHDEQNKKKKKKQSNTINGKVLNDTKQSSTVFVGNEKKLGKLDKKAARNVNLNVDNKAGKSEHSKINLKANKAQFQQNKKSATQNSNTNDIEENIAALRKILEQNEISDDEMPDLGSNQKMQRNAQNKRDGKLLNNEHVNRPEESEERLERTLFVGNVPNTIDHKGLQSLFKQFGKVQTARIRSVIPARSSTDRSKRVSAITQTFSKNCTSTKGYVVFENLEDAKKALAMSGYVLNGHHLTVSLGNDVKCDNKLSVFVGNLPFDVEDEMLWSTFKKCGTIKSVRVVRDRDTGIGKGFGFVQFQDIASVKKAVQLNDTEGCGRTLRVKYSNSNIKEQNIGPNKWQPKKPIFSVQKTDERTKKIQEYKDDKRAKKKLMRKQLREREKKKIASILNRKKQHKFF